MPVRTASDMSGEKRAQQQSENLGKRIVELRAPRRLIVAGQPPAPDMPHHAHDQNGIRPICFGRDMG